MQNLDDIGPQCTCVEIIEVITAEKNDQLN